MPTVPKGVMPPGLEGEPGLMADKDIKPGASQMMQAISVMNSTGRLGNLGGSTLPQGKKIKGGSAGFHTPRRSKSPKGTKAPKSLMR